MSFRDLIDAQNEKKRSHIFPENQQALKKKDYVSGLKGQRQENVRLAEAARGQA